MFLHFHPVECAGNPLVWENTAGIPREMEVGLRFAGMEFIIAGKHETLVYRTCDVL